MARNFNNYFVESLNLSVPFEYTSGRETPEATFTITTIDKGQALTLEYLVEFIPSLSNVGHYDFHFSLIKTGNEDLDSDPDKVSKAHNFDDKTISFKVFATLGKIIYQFLKDKKPKSFSFASNIEEKSRVRLYQTLAKRIERHFQYEKVNERIHTNNAGIKVISFLFKER